MKAAAKPQDPALALRAYLLIDGALRLLLWLSSLALTAVCLRAAHAGPPRWLPGPGLAAAWHWALRLALAVVLFNALYLAHLLVLRAVLPTAREGFYPLAAGGRIDPQILRATLASTLLRARYQPPFPGFLVFHLANLPPFCWLAGRVLGPRSRSVFPLDPLITDPRHTRFGRNVTIGYGTTVAAHTHDRAGVVLKKTVVEDDVIIGAHSLIYSGCTIRRGAVVYGGSIVRPDTLIGENEAWGGVPARKIKDLPPLARQPGLPATQNAEGPERC